MKILNPISGLIETTHIPYYYPLEFWERKTMTVPRFLIKLNPEKLISRGFKSDYIVGKTYFSSMRNMMNKFVKGDIEIWYGLFYAKCPPMLIRLTIKGKLIYQA